MSNTLAKGTYIIMGSAPTHRVCIGRDTNESRSLRPKKIMVVPDYVKAYEWQIESLPNGRYHLKSCGSPVAGMGDKLYAVVMPTGRESLEWIVTRMPSHGPAVYTIHDASMSTLWVLPDPRPHTQVSVRSTAEYNPACTNYAYNELFVILPDRNNSLTS